MTRLLNRIIGISFAAALATCCCSAFSQEISSGAHPGTLGDPTVSVASLRVPEKAWNHYRKALAADKAQRIEECDKEVQKALAIAPQFPEARLLRAARLVRAGQFEPALEAMSGARREGSALRWSGVVLAAAYNGLRRYDEALLSLAGLSGQDASSWQAMYERARAETGLGHAQAALTWSELAVHAAPASFPDAHLLRANALQVAGQWREATAEMEHFLASPHPEGQSAEVAAAMAFTDRRAREEEMQMVHTR